MEAQTTAVHASAHRLDEFPAGYSLAGCAPAEPAAASPAANQYALQSFCRSRIFQRTANSVLTVCVSSGGKRIASRLSLHIRLPVYRPIVLNESRSLESVREFMQENKGLFGGAVRLNP